jgi:hypothetical protein
MGLRILSELYQVRIMAAQIENYHFSKLKLYFLQLLEI